MTSILLDLHSLLTVWAPALPEGMASHLRSFFPTLTQTQTDGPRNTADILVAPLELPTSVTAFARRLHAVYGFTLLEYDGQPAVGYLYRGKADMLVVLSDPIRLLYASRRGNERRFRGCLLFCINLALKLRSALLAHGAVVEREGRVLVLASHRGGGKTGLLLKFLMDGWNYLSDDKFLLKDGKAYLFEPFLLLHHYHLKRYLGLLPQLRRGTGERAIAALRGGVRPLLETFAPRRLVAASERLLDPRLRIDPQSISPSCEIRSVVEPTQVFVLLQGSGFAVTRVSKEVAAQQLASIQEMLLGGFAPMEKLLLLYGGRIFPPVATLFSKNLSDLPCFNIHVPESHDVDVVRDRIAQCSEAP